MFTGLIVGFDRSSLHDDALLQTSGENLKKKSTAARSNIPAIYFFGFTKLSAAMLVVQRLVVEL